MLLVLVVTGETNHYALGHIELRNDSLFDVLSQFAEGGLIRSNLHFDVALAALTLDSRRSPVLANVAYLGQLDKGAGAGRNGEVLNFLDGIAVGLLESADDIVLRAVLLEEAARHTVDAVAEVGRDGVSSQAETAGFLLVHNNLDLGTLIVT